MLTLKVFLSSITGLGVVSAASAGIIYKSSPKHIAKDEEVNDSNSLISDTKEKAQANDSKNLTDSSIDNADVSPNVKETLNTKCYYYIFLPEKCESSTSN